MNLTTRYGSINADLIEKGFESVNINSGYSDISLSFDPGSSYNLDIRHMNAFLVLPDKNIKTEEKALDEDKKEYLPLVLLVKIREKQKLKSMPPAGIFI